MTFSVSVTEIRIGDFVETFPAMLEVWSEDDYRRQWADALDALERDGRAFLVTWAPPAGDDLWTVWELWRVGDEVRIRNSLLRPPITIEPYAPDDEVSEWTASIDEVAVFRATLEWRGALLGRHRTGRPWSLLGDAPTWPRRTQTEEKARSGLNDDRDRR